MFKFLSKIFKKNKSTDSDSDYVEVIPSTTPPQGEDQTEAQPQVDEVQTDQNNPPESQSSVASSDPLAPPPKVEKVDLNTIKEEKSGDIVDRVMDEILKIK